MSSPFRVVMTFMINEDGVLLQKDLGKATTETATAIFLSQEDEVIQLARVVAVAVCGKPDGDFGGNGQALDDTPV